MIEADVINITENYAQHIVSLIAITKKEDLMSEIRMLLMQYAIALAEKQREQQ